MEIKPSTNKSDVLVNYEKISDLEIQRIFESSFSCAETLFARINLASPAIETFVEAGVNFNYLADRYNKMKSEGLMPNLVIAPILTLTNSLSPESKNNWQNLYAQMIIDTTIPKNPLRVFSYAYKSILYESGLAFDEITSDPMIQEKLFNKELDFIINNPDVHQVNDKENRIWTIALVPGTKDPQWQNTEYDDYLIGDKPNFSKCTTISQYLSLQAISIQNGQPPLDSNKYTILHGVLEKTNMNYEININGHWHPDMNQVAIVGQRVYKDESIGVRLPTWG